MQPFYVPGPGFAEHGPTLKAVLLALAGCNPSDFIVEVPPHVIFEIAYFCRAQFRIAWPKPRERLIRHHRREFEVRHLIDRDAVVLLCPF